jgi:adenine-specific DNA-methyltransferase
MAAALAEEQTLLLARIAERSSRFFEEELEKLERWADDLKAGLEQELRELDSEIRAAKKEARVQPTLERKVAAHRRIKELEAERSRRRKSLFEAQDEVDSRKESLIAEIEGRLRQKIETRDLFTIRWRVE